MRISPPISAQQLTLAAALFLASAVAAAEGTDWISLGPENNFAAWRQPVGDWYEAGNAALDPKDPRRLIGKPGTGVMINGPGGRTASLVTKQVFHDVELYLEFMVARNSNSGVIFHGDYEIQIRDTYGKQPVTGADCGGIYPRAEAKPTYHYPYGGVPPRVNAAKQPGRWQALHIVFRPPRFDPNGNKTENARFVKVVLNGQVLYQDQEVPFPSGLNWRRKERPVGPIVLQGDYGPVAFRRVRVRPRQPRPASVKARGLNVPPPGFTALFNGKDFAGWRLSPLARRVWKIEDGALKSHRRIDRWGADLATAKAYKDFILLLEFRMPEISDSGINFRRLIPDMGNFGRAEQLNVRSRGGLCKLESFEFLPERARKKLGITDADVPHVPYIDPEVGVWHTIKLAVAGQIVWVEYDDKLLLDGFRYPPGLLSEEATPIRLQKHIPCKIAGHLSDCPIEYRNIFIKELAADDINCFHHKSCTESVDSWRWPAASPPGARPAPAPDAPGPSAFHGPSRSR